MTTYEEATEDELIEILKKYMTSDVWELHDFPTIIKRAKTIPERNIVVFELIFDDILLDTRDLSTVDIHRKK